MKKEFLMNDKGENMYNKKEIFTIIIFLILNIFLTYIITNIFNINNIIVFNLMTSFYGNITSESIIFILLSMIESIIYEYKKIS